jgi:UDP-galactopyranose mutase
LKDLSVPLTVCGRLGHYRYYDMDDAVTAARALAAKSPILQQK